MGTTTSQTTDDVNTIIAGMGQAPQQDRARAPLYGNLPNPLPPSLQPGYRPPMPDQLLSPSQLPPEITYQTLPPGGFQPSQQPDQPNYTMGPVRQGDPGYQPPQPPISPTTGQPMPTYGGQTPGGYATGPPGTSGPVGIDSTLLHDPTGRNNPGNIRIAGAMGPAGFQSFPTMQAGLQALQNNLLGYQDRYGINTIQGIISRWSPPNENDTEGLIKKAEATMGIDRNQRIDLHDPATLQKMTNVILAQEQQGTGRGGQPQPQQNLMQPMMRGYGEWGRSPPGFGMSQPGAMPQRSDFGSIMGNLAPLLVGIASLALRMPLSASITAYSAMERARQNGQNLEYERNRTRFQDQLKESTAQQTMESREASDAFSTYGENNPQGLQQALAGIALKYNDTAMYQLAERGDLNGIHKLQAQRDLYNQNLTKMSKAVEEEQERRDVAADVTARDKQWDQEHPNATPEERAIAHAQHRGQAEQDVAPGKVGQAGEQEGAVRDVIGPDGKLTGQQVRTGRGGGYFDPDTKLPVHLKPGERTLEPPREKAEGEQGGGLEVSKPYDVVDDQGHIVHPNVMLREARNKAGYVHSETGEPLKLEPGQSVKLITPSQTGGGRAGAQVLRQLVGGREVLSDLQNAVRLPVGTTTGLLGSVHPGPTVLQALTGDLARKLTDQDSQMMQASMASMERELSVLMSPVYGGNWAAQQITPLIPQAGNTLGTVIFKLARLAQSADNALEAVSKSPILSNEEQAYAKDLRKQINEAIPWTTGEAMDFVYRSHPKESFGDYVRRQGIGGGAGQLPTMPDWAKHSATGPDGQKIYSPDNQNWFHSDHTPVE